VKNHPLAWILLGDEESKIGNAGFVGNVCSNHEAPFLLTLNQEEVSSLPGDMRRQNLLAVTPSQAGNRPTLISAFSAFSDQRPDKVHDLITHIMRHPTLG
jgi:hypothetical protein